MVKDDLVVSRAENDPDGPLVLVPVDETFRRLADHLRNLDIRDVLGNSGVIQTTDEHPFFVRNRGRLAARDLRVGDVLMTRGGALLTVVGTSREEHPEGIPVYNLRVPGTHTYFVRPKPEKGTSLICAVAHRSPSLNIIDVPSALDGRVRRRRPAQRPGRLQRQRQLGRAAGDDVPLPVAPGRLAPDGGDLSRLHHSALGLRKASARWASPAALRRQRWPTATFTPPANGYT